MSAPETPPRALTHTDETVRFSLAGNFFKKSLCQLEHSSSEMKIVAICADQSRRNRRLAQQQGFWSLVTRTRGSHFSVCACRSAEETWEALGFALLRED